MTIAYLFLATILLTTRAESGQIDLLQLKSNWSGNGMAVLYPGAMKLLTQKINQQAGAMSTITQMPAGDTWEMDIDFKIACEGDASDLGVGFWLTLNDPKVSPLDYKFEAVSATYGMPPSVDGLGMIYANKSMYAGLMRSERVTRGDLLYRSKTCKVYVEEGKHVRFKVKYRHKVLGVYALEQKEKVESLCVQFTDVQNFGNFFVSASASTDMGKCTIDVNRFALSQPEKLFQIIDEKDKKAGDPFFALFPDMEKTKHYNSWEEYNNMFKLYRENSKILAQELLEFADINQKEMNTKITKEINQQIDKVTKAIDIIGKEAQQLESLSNYVEQDKKQTTASVEDLADQVIQWLNQMDEAYNTVDAETKRIHEVLSKLNISDKITTMIGKSENVVNALNSLLFKARDFTTDNALNSIDHEDIKYWDDQLNVVKNQLTDSIKKSSNTSTFKTIAYGFLAFIAGVIFVAFGYMYWKIQKAIRHKRIL